MNMENRKKAALYCRAANASDFGIETHEKLLRQYASEHGYDNISVYADNGYSGLKYDRPAFMQMDSDIQAGLIDTVIAKDIARISRSYLYFGKWIDCMCGRNVRVIVVNERLDSDSYNTVNASFTEAIEKYYKETHSQRTKAGIAHARQRRLEQAAKLAE